ncbi:GNAT family N-acetyltransferase [Bacillus alkalisoli]|uniref:GNAT family N-acetyltransferase n=1 Tax=Bacillus alkalisoli TaxID=2011008 RepID=UPI000C234732|nr:GNAT family N-acetyltransferase [Bacillus alkalisoli]
MNILFEQTHNLNNEQFKDVIHLLERCESFDKVEIASSINVSMLENAEEKHLYFILGYENLRLVSFLGLYSFIDSEKIEIAGMVHPDFRQKKIFSTMLNSGLTICKERNAKEILFVCPSRSNAAKGLMKKLDAPYSFSEYTMELKEYVPILGESEITLLKTEAEDIDIVTSLLLDGFDFGGDPESVKPLIRRNLNKSGYDLFVVKDEENEVYATLTVSDEKQSYYISAFTVAKSKRGQGLGRKILRETVEHIRMRNSKLIRLDVDVKNENALGLYEGVGFRKVSGYDYYSYKI